MNSSIKFVLFLIAVLMGLPITVIAEDPPVEQSGLKKLANHFDWDLRIYTYGILQQTADSTQNPSNSFLNVSPRMANVEVRPDLRFSSDRLELSAKPRLKIDYSTGGNNVPKERDGWENDRRLNEWLARLKVRENLFVSYGRENLQWGPSFLFSPSNPFFTDNGRRNTYMEISGMDFGRVVWLPGGPWGVSFIANTGEGANKTLASGSSLSSVPGIIRFEKTYAVKIDYTGREKYASLILSRKTESETRVGFYGGWTATDALLLYGEGTIAQGSRALYPVEDTSPFGFSMKTLHKHDAAFCPAVLAGASYTFMSKGALTMEYAYYGPGYTALEVDRYDALRSKAAEAFESGGNLSGLGRHTLGMTALTGLRFLRRNYVMVQYSQPDIADRFDMTFRWTQGLDDQSYQLTSILGFPLGKHMEIFSVATFMIGSRNREYTSVLDRQWQVGLQYTF